MVSMWNRISEETNCWGTNILQGYITTPATNVYVGEIVKGN